MATAPQKCSTYIHVVHGDIGKIQADAVVYPTSCQQKSGGTLQPDVIPGFREAYAQKKQPFGSTYAYWIDLDAQKNAKNMLPRRPLQGVIVAQTVAQKNKMADEESIRRSATEAVQLAASAFAKRKHVILAFPALGAGAGGAKYLLQMAKAQVDATATALEALSDDAPRYLDVIIVAYNEGSLHRFLQARESVRAQASRACLTPPLPENDADAAHTHAIAASALRGECILFAGSGPSTGAGMTSWKQLIYRLLEDLPEELKDEYRDKKNMPNYRRLSFDEYLDIAHWHALAAKKTHAEDATPSWGDDWTPPEKSHQAHIRDLFGSAQPQPIPPTVAHFHLMGMPWRHVVTTNYDDLFERTTSAQRRPYETIVSAAMIPRAGHGNAVSVFKFHGDARTGDGIVLTRDEYERFFEQHPARVAMLEGLMLNHHVLFYGYSLSDWDLRLIHNRVERMLKENRRTNYVITTGEVTAWRDQAWREKGLLLLGFGDDSGSFIRMERWLDRLRELSTAPQSLFLMDPKLNAPLSPRMAPLQATLLTLGRDLLHAITRDTDAPIPPSELAVMTTTLDLLQKLGWRPLGKKYDIHSLWIAIAEHYHATPSSDPEIYLSLLWRALGASSDNQKMKKIRKKIKSIEQKNLQNP